MESEQPTKVRRRIPVRSCEDCEYLKCKIPVNYHGEILYKKAVAQCKKGLLVNHDGTVKKKYKIGYRDQEIAWTRQYFYKDWMMALSCQFYKTANTTMEIVELAHYLVQPQRDED